MHLPSIKDSEESLQLFHGGILGFRVQGAACRVVSGSHGQVQSKPETRNQKPETNQIFSIFDYMYLKRKVRKKPKREDEKIDRALIYSARAESF